MEFKMYPFDTLENYFGVDIVAVYKGKWIFCKHKGRVTWENPGGHIDAGETPLEAAKRELYEESGAANFDIEPLCDYFIDVEINGKHYRGNVQVYFAVVHALDELPAYTEMEKIELFDNFPSELTYPMLRGYFPMALEKRNQALGGKSDTFERDSNGGNAERMS